MSVAEGLKFMGRNRSQNQNRNLEKKFWDPEPERRQNGTVSQNWLQVPHKNKLFRYFFTES
jgi:hypothetical protein